jgi:hypothetical protein
MSSAWSITKTLSMFKTDKRLSEKSIKKIIMESKESRNADIN